MTSPSYSKDLVVLVADKNTEFGLKGILARCESLRIRPITSDIFVHKNRDAGCLLGARDFLRIFVNSYAHALVVFDLEGCGKEGTGSAALEADVQQRLSQSGWGTRAAAIVLDPELEAWVWSDSPQVDLVLGWQGRDPDLRFWLMNEGLLGDPHSKPARPRGLEMALWNVRKPRSSSLYMQLAQHVGLERCTDPAFGKLRRTLYEWFAAGESHTGLTQAGP
ncbi:MAG: hypothetical protein HY000_36775 [Planctomycetes bacterium]|nr:hypothetical protein [Planctomycetota bacterium]